MKWFARKSVWFVIGAVGPLLVLGEGCDTIERGATLVLNSPSEQSHAAESLALDKVSMGDYAGANMELVRSLSAAIRADQSDGNAWEMGRARRERLMLWQMELACIQGGFTQAGSMLMLSGVGERLTVGGASGEFDYDKARALFAADCNRLQGADPRQFGSLDRWLKL